LCGAKERAGTIGTAIVVALMENNGGAKLSTEPAVFTEVQQFAFAGLVLIGGVSVGIALKNLPRAVTVEQ